MAEEEDTVERKESTTTSDQRKSAFGFGGDEGQEGLGNDLQNLGGDEGVDVDERDLQDVDPDTPIDDLDGATDGSEVLIESPPDKEAEPDDSEPDTESSESEEAETEDFTADVPEEVLEVVKENPEQVKNLQEWQKELTQRSQALSDLETLAELRQIASQDPGRVEALREFAEDLADGKYDADREVEVEDVEIPEGVQDTEYEDLFRQLADQNKQLAEKVNRQSKMLAQQQQVQSGQGQQQPDELVGQGQATAATDELNEDVIDEEIDKLQSFVSDHPELTDENGDATDELEEIQDVVSRSGGALSWEEAYYSVMGPQIRDSAKQSAKKEEDLKEKNSRTATPTSELTDEGQSVADQGDQNRYDQLINSKGRRDELADRLEEVGAG